jgi:hypothetical protein
LEIEIEESKPISQSKKRSSRRLYEIKCGSDYGLQIFKPFAKEEGDFGFFLYEAAQN